MLDENTSNKIAAGEVVERPSSVVKELVENSIDANAKNITIEIYEGGTTLIRIIDDGDGIHPDDIKKAFMPHATSKIKNENDIFSISSLGFRGEALPSIAAVSVVSIKSKIDGEDFGRELNISGGIFDEIIECASNKGTTIEIRDLFYNVPARKKFLKSTSRETSIISDIINRIAIANPQISFKLYNGNKVILQTFGSGKPKDVLRTVYGKSISENILYFENVEDTITIYGFIGKEEIARGSRNNQSIFVNGRYIKHKTIVAAVENAFKSFSTVNKFPFFTLFIEVFPEFVDVNIHPTKAEVKFEDDRLIFKKVFDTVHSTLKEDIFKTFEIPEEKKSNTFVSDVTEEIKMNIAPLEAEEKVHVSIPVDLGTKSFDNLTYPIKENASVADQKIQQVKENPVELSNFENIDKTPKLEVKDTAIKLESEPLKTTEKTPKFPPIRIIGQFNKTYILGEYDEVLYLIDQHAAHEKILFEKYLKNIQEDNIIIQPLLVPIMIELTLEDFAYVEENKQIFISAGFTIEDFGGNTLALKEVPYFLGKLENKALFLSILDNLKALGSGSRVEIKYNKIASMACKAAVKGNDYLTEFEMVKLVEDLRYIDDPFHCPHGRPTIIKFTNYDLEKKFRRIV